MDRLLVGYKSHLEPPSASLSEIYFNLDGTRREIEVGSDDLD